MTMERLVRGDNPTRATKKVARKAAGEAVVVTTDEWLTALREIDGLVAEFTPHEALRDSYLWYEDGAYRAANLGSGLEHKEGTPLDRHSAGALLDLGFMPSVTSKEGVPP